MAGAEQVVICACGQWNRLQLKPGAPKGIFKCSKCASELAYDPTQVITHATSRRISNRLIVYGIAGCVGLATIASYASYKSLNHRVETTIPNPSLPPFEPNKSKPVPISVKSGTIRGSVTGVSTLEVTADHSANYVVKITNTKTSAETALLYVEKGQRAATRLPAGTYRLPPTPKFHFDFAWVFTKKVPRNKTKSNVSYF